MTDRDRPAELRQLAHDVRNALNGVAVNLEVARGRAQRGVDVAEVAPFLETAAQQLDAALRLHKHYSEVAAGVTARTENSESQTASSTPDGTSLPPVRTY